MKRYFRKRLPVSILMPKFAAQSIPHFLIHKTSRKGGLLQSQHAHVPPHRNCHHRPPRLRRPLSLRGPHADVVDAGMSLSPADGLVVRRLRPAARTLRPDARTMCGSVAVQPVPLYACPVADGDGVCRNPGTGRICKKHPQTTLHTMGVCCTNFCRAALDSGTEYTRSLTERLFLLPP